MTPVSLVVPLSSLTVGVPFRFGTLSVSEGRERSINPSGLYRMWVRLVEGYRMFSRLTFAATVCSIAALA